MVLVLALAAAGCDTGDGAATDAGDLDTSGSADGGGTADPADAAADAPAVVTAQGTIGGASLDPVSALAGTNGLYVFVFTSLVTLHHEVAIANFADYCGNGDVTGRMLYLDFFEDPSQPDSRVTQPATFEIWLPPLNGGEPIPTGNRAIATFAETGPDGGSGAVAQSGSLTVSAISEAEMAGTFDLTFEDGHLTGTFEAPLCAEWTRSASIP